MPLANPVDRQGLETAFRVALEEATGINWIRARQRPESPRPARPFGTYEVTTLDPLGTGDETYVLDEGDPVVSLVATGLRQGNLSCNVYGDSAKPESDPATYCDRATAALAFDDVREALNEAGLGIHEVSAVRRLDLLENNQYEQRSQFDITFSVRSYVTKPVDFFETVEISATTTDGDALWINPQTFSLDTPES